MFWAVQQRAVSEDGPYRRPRTERPLAELEIAGADVGVELVFTWAGFLERAEEAAVLFVEGSGGNIAGGDGGFDARIVFGITDVNGQVTGVEFDVFAAGDVFDGDVAGGNARVEFQIAWNADFDGEVIARPATQTKFGAAGSAPEAITEVFDFVLVSAGDVHGEFSVFGANDADFTRADVKGDFGSRRNLRFKMGNTPFGDFGFVRPGDGKGDQR